MIESKRLLPFALVLVVGASAGAAELDLAGAIDEIGRDEMRKERTTAEKIGEGGSEADSRDEEHLRLSDEPIPMLVEDELPPRLKPLIELGTKFQGSGKIGRGFELPTGAVWTPGFWVFGQYRTGLSYFDRAGSEEIFENPHRLDLFMNLQLTGTERLLLNLQPLHQDGRFTTFTFTPDGDEDWHTEENLDVGAFFFEGDFGEIFPRLDPSDRKGLDIGFAIGRQLIEFQDGIMFNDVIDSIGITRTNVFFPGVPNLRTTLLYGWGDIHRDNNLESDDAQVLALLAEADLVSSIVEADVAYVSASAEDAMTGGDGLYWGVGSIQRIGRFNTTFRANGSYALDDENAAVSDGWLLFTQISTNPRGTHDVAYLDAFWGIDRYSSAARAPTAGGPLGGTGILFAAFGLGRFAPALGNRADDSYGAALGYQKVMGKYDEMQIVLEVGGRESTEDEPGAVAIGGRFQKKLGQRYLLQIDSYISGQESRGPNWGVRSEIQVRF